VKKFVLWVLMLMLLLAATLPLGAYWLGMNNITEKPQPLAAIRVTESQARAVWRERQEIFPIALRPITPYHFYELLWCSRNDDAIEDYLACDDRYPGLRAAAYVAKHYLDTHLHKHGLIWRYLSRASLVIWISRNWTVQELVAELIRIKNTPYPR